ncbi:MAG: hypothetical protein FWC55_02140 [Firmicutes bacterium]|nr:hypothetical protein [Bacillota bacterium]
MDYEELYQKMQALEKEFSDKLALAQKTFKSMAKNSEKGDLKALAKDLSAMGVFIGECESLVAGYSAAAEGFDAGEYMESGDFAGQMTAFCEKLAVDVKGEYPVYEMFPFKVKIDGENHELVVDRRRVQCCRPLYFVKSIKQSQEKLNKASFNVTAFLNELARAYDVAVKYKDKPGKAGSAEQDIHLKDIYEFLAPMQRFRKEYDMQSFAFDLARLYGSDAETAKDGRSYQFGTSRNAGKLIRILDKDGREQYLGTIRFYKRDRLESPGAVGV